MTMHIATQQHIAIYRDPIIVGKGEQLLLSGKTDTWQGHNWLWAKSAGEREGWVPDNLPVTSNGQTIAAYDYSAIELDVCADDRIEILEQSHGWAWCLNQSNNEGWVPLNVLKPCQKLKQHG